MMTGSLQERTSAGEAPVAPQIMVPSSDSRCDGERNHKKQPQARGVSWPVLWTLLAALAAILSTLYVLVSGGRPGGFLALLALVVCLLAAFSDARTGRIPNRLTYPAVLVGLALNALVPLLQWMHWQTALAWLGAPGYGASLAGFGACLVVGLAGAILGGVHGGDLKLLCAVGAMLGLTATTNVLLLTIALGLIYALINLLCRGRLVLALRLATQRLMEWHFLRQFHTPLEDAEPHDVMHFPMAVPLALGLVLALCWQWRSGEVLL